MVEERTDRETTYTENNDDLFKLHRFGPNQFPSLAKNSGNKEIIEKINEINFRLNVVECYNPKIIQFTESLKKELYDADYRAAVQEAEKKLRSR